MATSPDSNRVFELADLVAAWARERGIVTDENLNTQLVYALNEYSELVSAHLLAKRLHNKGLNDDILDGIGDTLVPVLVFAAIKDIDLRGAMRTLGFSPWNNSTQDDCLLGVGFTLGHLAKAHQKHEGSSDVYAQRILDVIDQLHAFAQTYNTTVEDGLAHTYEQIKNRKGKTVGGVFIKEEAKQ